MRKTLDSLAAAALIAVALAIAFLQANARHAEPGEPDAVARSMDELKGMTATPEVATFSAIWVALSGATAITVGIYLVGKKIRGEKLPDPLAEPPPWGVAEFLLVFMISLAGQQRALAAIPRTQLALEDRKQASLALPAVTIQERNGELRLRAEGAPVLVNDDPFPLGERPLRVGDRVQAWGVQATVEGPSPTLQLLVAGLSSALAPLLVFVAVKLRGASLKELGLEGFTSMDVLRGVVGCVAMTPGVIAASLLWAYVCKSIGIAPIEHPLLLLLERSHDTTILLLELLVAAVIAPISEEILFRGYLLRALRGPVPSRMAAILISSFFFAAFHPISTLLPILWVGSVFAFLFSISARRSLLASIVCHMLFNGVQIGLVFASHG